MNNATFISEKANELKEEYTVKVNETLQYIEVQEIAYPDAVCRIYGEEVTELLKNKPEGVTASEWALYSVITNELI